MTEFQFPSRSVSGLPAFTCALPDGWSATEAAGVWASFRPATTSDVLLAVSSVRVDRALALRDVAVRSFAQQRAAHPDAEIESQRVGRFDGRATYLRSVRVPSAGLTQLHALAFAPSPADRPVADVFALVGTCPTAEIAHRGPEFVDIVASLRFTGS